MLYLLISTVVGYLVLGAAIYLLLQERQRDASERSELLNRIQRPSYTPPPQREKARTADSERQRRIDEAMRKVGQVVPNGDA